MEQNEKDPINQTEENVVSNNEQPVEEATAETVVENTNEPINYEAKIAELNDKYLRLYSEFDNYRKRTIKEKSDIIRSAGEDVFKAIMPTIDDFERAIKANETVTEIEPIKEGISLIYHKLKVLRRKKNARLRDFLKNKRSFSDKRVYQIIRSILEFYFKQGLEKWSEAAVGDVPVFSISELDAIKSYFMYRRMKPETAKHFADIIHNL